MSSTAARRGDRRQRAGRVHQPGEVLALRRTRSSVTPGARARGSPPDVDEAVEFQHAQQILLCAHAQANANRHAVDDEDRLTLRA
jgi:hypothetical protein